MPAERRQREHRQPPRLRQLQNSRRPPRSPPGRSRSNACTWHKSPSAISGTAASSTSCQPRRTSGRKNHAHHRHTVRYTPRLAELSSGPRARPKWMPSVGSAMYRGNTSDHWPAISASAGEREIDAQHRQESPASRSTRGARAALRGRSNTARPARRSSSPAATSARRRSAGSTSGVPASERARGQNHEQRREQPVAAARAASIRAGPSAIAATNAATRPTSTTRSSVSGSGPTCWFQKLKPST